jgi:hypothetical protein
MKRILRSKSETDIFFDKEYLNLIHDNLNKFKQPKNIKNESLKKKKKNSNTRVNEKGKNFFNFSKTI